MIGHMTKRSLRPGLPAMLWAVAAVSAAAGPLRIHTVNYPLQYFAERIAGPHAEVVLPAPPEVDPAFWLPDAAVINQYQGADLVLLNGAGYARWVGRATLPRSRLVDTSAGFREDYLAGQRAVTHSHGPGGEHAHTGTAFTTWLDFSLAARQAAAIRDAVVRLRPELRQEVEENFVALERDLLTLAQQAKALGLYAKGMPMLASHPVYQYLAGAYGLNLRSVHWEFDQTPDGEQWAELEAVLRRHPARIMLWEGAPRAGVVERLQSLGIRSVVFEPAANRPGRGDWLSVMRANLARLEDALSR